MGTDIAAMGNTMERDHQMRLWTLRNIASAIGYHFIRAAPIEDRCIMGSPVHPALHCPRRVISQSALFCRYHYDKHDGREVSDE